MILGGGSIIQGVRGEGKGLAAVYLMKQYIARGCPVATNMTIYLDKLAPKNSTVPVYRLPDFPRVEDFNLLPPAYDTKYKGEDRNGLIVLDELALWMNSRTFKDKQRLAIIGWLILSRKNHWDLVLTVQSFEMIDAQIRTTLCDFLVQASRSDRQKIPLFGSFLSFLGFSPFGRQVHTYHVYYGMSLNQVPQDNFSFTGKEVYSAYDTNQKLEQDNLVYQGASIEDVRVVDFRATYTYLPASYLSGQYYIDKEQKVIDNAQRLADSIKLKRKKRIKEIKNPTRFKKAIKAAQSKETDLMAIVKDTSSFSPKFILLLIALVGFVSYKFILNPPSYLADDSEVLAAAPVQNGVTAPVSKSNRFKVVSASQINHPVQPTIQEIESSFLDEMLKDYRPRLSGVIKTVTGTDVLIAFYDRQYNIVETLKMAHLHELGGTVILKDYGVFLRTAKNMMLVTAWNIPDSEDFKSNQVKQQNINSVSSQENNSDLLSKLL